MDTARSAVISCFPCQRTFPSAGLLRQHLKTSAAHPYCEACDQGFQTDSGYRSHCKGKHTPECRPCRSTFPTWEELEEHWQTSETHPKCSKCTIGFEEYRTYVTHMHGRHTSTACVPCSGLIILNEDLDKHYLESSRHPSCSSCHAGFLDDATFAEHARTVHSSSHCQTCDRHFDSESLLRIHYAKSVRHPMCLNCGSGFMDEDALNEHFPSCKSVDGQAPLHPSDITPTKRTPMIRGSGLYGHHSTPSEADLTDMAQSFMTPSPSPAKPQHEMGLPPFPAAPYQRSPLALQPPSRPRAPSDPGVSPMRRSGSMMSELDLVTAAFGSPAAAPSIVFGHMRPRDQSPSPMPMVPQISVVDATIVLEDDGDLGVFSEQDMGEAGVPRLLMPEILQLRLEAARHHASAGSSVSSGTDTPTVVEGITSRSISPFPGYVNGAPFAYPPREDVPKIHCRACGKDPCDVPTATMCGHIFCKDCIEDTIIRTSRCPVCAQAVLLYCLFRLHLD